MFGIKEKLAPICVTAAAACVLALAGCGSSNGMTGGVAATVNGVDIPEDKVTTYIQDLRASQSMTSEKDWGEYLNSIGYTPESVREEVVDSFVYQELEKQTAATEGVEVTDEDVDAEVQKMRANYDSDEAFQSALESANLTEESYRENIYMAMLQEKLIAAVIDEDKAKTDDETILSYVQMYASSFDDMKRSSHILFAADDKDTAQKVLDELNNGADFAEMAKQYSTDAGSAENGGDVGWSGINSFVTAYSDALDKLEKGETSGLVTSEYGIHIIRCTDEWVAPDEIKSLDDVPQALVDYVHAQTDPYAAQTAFSDYMDEIRDKADVHVNDMPANVPYNVDMSKYTTSEGAEDDEDEGEDADADVTVEDEGAEDELEIDGDDVEVVDDDEDAGDEASEDVAVEEESSKE